MPSDEQESKCCVAELTDNPQTASVWAINESPNTVGSETEKSGHHVTGHVTGVCRGNRQNCYTIRAICKLYFTVLCQNYTARYFQKPSFSCSQIEVITFLNVSKPSQLQASEICAQFSLSTSNKLRLTSCLS